MHFLHDAVLIGVIALYGLGVYSGYRALVVLSKRSDFSMRKVVEISGWCLASVFSKRPAPSFSLIHLWGLVWVIVNSSTIASVIFCVKNIEYMIDGGSRILGTEWAYPWIVAHLGAGVVALLVHAAVHGFTPLFELEMKTDD